MLMLAWIGGVLLATAAASPTPAEGPVPPVLAQARKLAEDLRFEEALVEYQRYLGNSDRPPRERAQALLELALLHQALADEVNALKRAVEALELHPALSLPSGAASKQVALLNQARKQLRGRVRLELLPRAGDEPPSRVRARLTDPERRSRQVLLRHALAADGPYWSAPMQCLTEECAGDIPQPAGAADYQAWYYVQANDAQGNTVAQAAGPASPMQVYVRYDRPWYSNPWVWVGGAAVLVSAGTLAYVATRPATPAPP
jgi:tetratricopeptide (TPR) repeat protein